MLLNKARTGLNILTELGIGELIRYAPEYLTELIRHKVDTFDMRYGTDTNKSMSVAELDVAALAKADAELYWPVREAGFSSIIENLDIPPQQLTFIDFGSGKGRGLMLAAEKGFKRIMGVEFSTTLCRISEKNMVLFRKAHPQAPPLETHCIDARMFEFPGEPLFIFLFDPFGAEILEQVLDRLLQSLQSRPRIVRLAYNLPMHRSVVTSKGFTCLAERRRNWKMNYPWVLFKGPFG